MPATAPIAIKQSSAEFLVKVKDYDCAAGLYGQPKLHGRMRWRVSVMHEGSQRQTPLGDFGNAHTCVWSKDASKYDKSECYEVLLAALLEVAKVLAKRCGKTAIP